MKFRITKSANFEFTKAITRVKALQNKLEETQVALVSAQNIIETGNRLPASISSKCKWKTTDDLIHYFQFVEERIDDASRICALILEASKSE